MRNCIALREIPQDTCIIYVWRLPSLVCEHISYAAWCFSVTCFYNISLPRAWLINGIESLICPLLFFSLIIDFFSLFFFTIYLNYIPHRKRNGVLTLKRLGTQMGWLNDLLTFLSDTDSTCNYLLIADVEQMSYLLKWNTGDGFFKQTHSFGIMNNEIP